MLLHKYAKKSEQGCIRQRRLLPTTSTFQVQRRLPVNLEDENEKWIDYDYKLMQIPDKTTDPSKFTNDHDK